MATPYVGEIRIFAGNFAPAGWMFCEGQLELISENETLFNLIGTTYGGDGQTTFALPDLRGRVPIHMGNGFQLAETGGVEEVTLTINEIPAHNHFVSDTSVSGKVFAQALGGRSGTSSDPLNKYPTMVPGLQQYTKKVAEGEFSKPVISDMQTKSMGGNQPHSNMQPYLCVNFIISLYGLFPTPS